MTTIQDRARKLYGAGPSDIRHATASYFPKLRARLVQQNDLESLRGLTQAEADAAKAATNRGMRVDDAHTLFAVLDEYQQFKRSREAIERRSPEDWKILCREHGGEAGARAALARATKFQQELAAEAPYIGELMSRTGASGDPRVIAVAAKYGASDAPQAA